MRWKGNCGNNVLCHYGDCVRLSVTLILDTAAVRIVLFLYAFGFWLVLRILCRESWIKMIAALTVFYSSKRCGEHTNKHSAIDDNIIVDGIVWRKSIYVSCKRILFRMWPNEKKLFLSEHVRAHHHRINGEKQLFLESVAHCFTLMISTALRLNCRCCSVRFVASTFSTSQCKRWIA